MMASKQSRRSSGFTLLELLISMVVLLVVVAVALSAVAGLANNYGSTMMKADTDSGVRSAAESMTQEIGQAGIVPYSALTLTAAVVGSTTAQTVAVNSSANLFVGQFLQVDTGNQLETVQLTAIPSGTSVTGKFTLNHVATAPIDPSGVFPQGIMANSTGNVLGLVGDLNGDGTIVYVEYDCNPNAAGTGTLTRSITTLPAAAMNPSTVLLQNLLTNPVIGNTCFTVPAVTSVNGYNFYTTVGVTLTVQSSTKDPQTQAYQTLTKSFMNISPRNVLAGLDMATGGLTTRLQPNPPSTPL